MTVTVQSEKQDTGIELFSELGCSTFPTPSKTRKIMRRQEGCNNSEIEDSGVCPMFEKVRAVRRMTRRCQEPRDIMTMKIRL